MKEVFCVTKQRYVLITAAKNEQEYIERTIRAVISQTVSPQKWVIVNDGSTDRTEEIIKRYAKKYEFIQLLQVSENRQRDFCSKVYALHAGYEQLRNEEYEFVGNLDADVSFDAQYYDKILEHFLKNPKLGIAGGIIWELLDDRFVSQNISLNSVAGAIQLFRRPCYEEIGGYKPLKFGGEDAITEVLARKNGWLVQTFPEIKVFHHRRVTIGKGNILTTRFRQGMRDYLLGYHPVFYAAMCFYRVIDQPYFFGSIFKMCGYFWAAIQRERRVVPADFIKYLRWEQVRRLRFVFSKKSEFVKTSRFV